MMTMNRLHVSPPCFSHLKNVLQRSLHKSTRTSSLLSTSEQYSLMWTCHTSDLFSVLLMDFWVFSSVLRFKVVFLYQEISQKEKKKSLCISLFLIYCQYIFGIRILEVGTALSMSKYVFIIFRYCQIPLPSVVLFACPMTLQENGCFLSVSPQRMLSSGFVSVSQLKKGFSTWFQFEFLSVVVFQAVKSQLCPLDMVSFH